MEQLGLFVGIPVAKRPRRWIETQPAVAGVADTSRAAAESLDDATLSKQRLAVLAALRACGETGATREELAERAGVKVCAVCARVAELLQRGEAVESGRRPGASGRSAKVLIATRKV